MPRSPLILGIGDEEYYLASDASAVVEYTKHVSYLNDGEMVVISRERGYQIKTLDNVTLTREVEELSLSLQEIQKGEYKHFMLKEIFEQPEVRTRTPGRGARGLGARDEGWTYSLSDPYLLLDADALCLAPDTPLTTLATRHPRHPPPPPPATKTPSVPPPTTPHPSRHPGP